MIKNYKFEVTLRKNCIRSQHFELSPNKYEIKNAIILIRRFFLNCWLIDILRMLLWQLLGKCI